MRPPRGGAAIRAAFDRARERGQAAFVAYVLAGYPDTNRSLAAARAALDNGADLLEVGVPFSDPVADGPLIASAARQAIERGAGLQTALGLIAALRNAGHEQPLLVMSYLNPLLRHRGSPRAAFAALREAGGDGLIVPDLPAGEEPGLERLAAAHDLAMSFLVAPNTAPDRIRDVAAASTGFLYAVPLFGVTGARDHLQEGAAAMLRQVRSLAGGVPVAAGFGVSTPEHAGALAGIADGVVVGSALVAELADGAADGPARLGQRVRLLSDALRPTDAARPARPA